MVLQIPQATRRKLLGNSFQVDNICYLLSPLKVQLASFCPAA